MYLLHLSEKTFFPLCYSGNKRANISDSWNEFASLCFWFWYGMWTSCSTTCNKKVLVGHFKEPDGRPLTPEMIDQHEAPEPAPVIPMSDKDRKAQAKLDKERLKVI